MIRRAGSIEIPLLPARSIPRRDGSSAYEVWCEWCEAIHRHDHIDGDLPARCDQAGHSPYLKTGYRAKAIGQDEPFGAGAFPSGAAVGSALGVRKFSSSFRFTVSPIRRGLLRGLFLNSRRSLIFSETIQNTRISVNETNWNAVDAAGNYSKGDNLLSLISRVFAVSAGVAAVRFVELATGVQFDDRGRLEIAAAINATAERLSPQSKAQAK